MQLTQHITSHLSRCGLPKPPQNLIEKLEKKLDESISEIVRKSLTTKVIAKAFAECLTNPELSDSPSAGGTEGGSPCASRVLDDEVKTKHVAGAASSDSQPPQEGTQ